MSKTTKTVYTVTFSFDQSADAHAFASLVTEEFSDLSILPQISTLYVKSPAKKGEHRASQQRLGILIIDFLSDGKLVPMKKIEQYVETHNYKASSVAPMLYFLKKEGVVESKGTRGDMQFTVSASVLIPVTAYQTLKKELLGLIKREGTASYRELAKFGFNWTENLADTISALRELVDEELIYNSKGCYFYNGKGMQHVAS